jgi:hypothetical protein
VAVPWLEFSESHNGPAPDSEDASAWGWPVNEAQLRRELLAHGASLALVRLFPARRSWWETEPLTPLAHVSALLPDLAERLVPVPGWSASGYLPVELRVWSVPKTLLDRVSATFERDALPQVIRWLVANQKRNAALPDVGNVTVHLHGDEVRVTEG